MLLLNILATSVTSELACLRLTGIAPQYRKNHPNGPMKMVSFMRTLGFKPRTETAKIKPKRTKSSPISKQVNKREPNLWKDVSVLSVDATVWGFVRVTPERSARQAREINRARRC